MTALRWMAGLRTSTTAAMLVASMTAFLAMPAAADLAGSIGVDLLAPGGFLGDPAQIPIALHDTVAAKNATLVSSGDGSNIGGIMLPGELIAANGNQLDLTIAGGDQLPDGTIVTGVVRRQRRILCAKDAARVDLIQRLMPVGYWDLFRKRLLPKGSPQ